MRNQYDYESRRRESRGSNPGRDRSPRSFDRESRFGEGRSFESGWGNRGRESQYYGGEQRGFEDRPDRWEEGGYGRGNREFQGEYEGQYGGGEMGRQVGGYYGGGSRGMGSFERQFGGGQIGDRQYGRPWGAEYGQPGRGYSQYGSGGSE